MPENILESMYHSYRVFASLPQLNCLAVSTCFSALTSDSLLLAE